MESKRFYRSREPKILGGVCAGLGKYFNMDVVLVRLLFALGMFFSCIFPVFIIYIILWILAPLEPIEPKPVIDGYQPKDDLDTSDPPSEEQK